AVIVFVDSRGGSAAASEAMAAAIEELAKSRPVITYMHNVAASGGYYVATPTRWIVTQPGTITGSIGVISGKATTGALYDKLRLNRIEMTRGANADFLTDTRPLTPANRERMRQIVEHLYGQFIGRVAESRSMTREAVDAIAGGRVWTGKQALEYGLVDALGGLDVALKHARKLAKLPDDTPLVMTHPRDKTPIGPMLAEKANPAAWVRYVNDGIRLLYTGRALFMDADLIE
ncbi:MAG: signal peptide peptidase SppA, partial [Chloroflexota bacterium]